MWWAGRLVCNAGDLIKVHDSRNSGETGPWPRQWIGRAQAFGNPSLPEVHRVGHGEAVRQRGGDRGRQRVTTAMVIAGG